MKDITVKKAALLEVLQKNRDEHGKIFSEAMDGFAKEAEATLQKYLEMLRNGKRRSIHVSMPVPENHTKDYDRVIGMVKMHLGDEFVLSERDYQAYVDDDWAWVGQFMRETSAFSALSRAKYGDLADDD